MIQHFNALNLRTNPTKAIFVNYRFDFESQLSTAVLLDGSEIEVCHFQHDQTLLYNDPKPQLCMPFHSSSYLPYILSTNLWTPTPSGRIVQVSHGLHGPQAHALLSRSQHGRPDCSRPGCRQRKHVLVNRYTCGRWGEAGWFRVVSGTIWRRIYSLWWGNLDSYHDSWFHLAITTPGDWFGYTKFFLEKWHWIFQVVP